MANSASVFLGALVLAAGVAASGPLTEIERRLELRNETAACWSPTIIPVLNALATQEASPILKDSFPSDMQQSDQDTVSKSFSVMLSNLSFANESGDWGTINCDATMSFSYSRPDGTRFLKNDGNVVSYTIHPAQSGLEAEMSRSDIPASVIAYVPSATKADSN